MDSLKGKRAPCRYVQVLTVTPNHIVYRADAAANTASSFAVRRASAASDLQVEFTSTVQSAMLSGHDSTL